MSAVRSLFGPRLAALALAAAAGLAGQPVSPSGPPASAGRPRSAPATSRPAPASAAVILIDNSLSMAAGAGKGSRLAWAKAEARSLLTGKDRPARAAVLATNGAGGAPAFSARTDELLEALARIQPGFAAAATADRLAAAVELLRDQPPGPKAVYLFSDLQRRSFEPVVRRRWGRDVRDVRLFVIHAAGESRNVGIADLKVSGARAAREVLRFNVTLVNSSPVKRVVSAALKIDGRRQGDSGTVLEPAGRSGSTGRVTLLRRFDKPGLKNGRVVITPDDDLPADDVRRFSLSVGDRVPALVVDGAPGGDRPPERSGAWFVRVALDPFEGKRPGTSVAPKVIAAAEFRPARLAEAEVVFLCDVPSFSRAQAEALGACARRGGTVVFFPGPNVNVDDYNRRLLGADEGDGGLLPGRLSAPVGQDRPDGKLMEARWVDVEHPYLRGLYAGKDNYPTVSVARHYPLKPGKPWRVLMRLPDGDPLLLSRRLGTGRVVFWTTGASHRWSDLPMRAVFLPLLNRIALAARTDDPPPAGFLCGQAVPIRLAFPAGTAPERIAVTVTDETGRRQVLKLPVSKDRRGHAATFRRTHRPGLYRWEATVAGRGVSGAFAVNPDGSESDLTAMGPREFLARMARAGWRKLRVSRSVADAHAAAELGVAPGPDGGKPVLVVLVDRSASMAAPDGPEQPGRHDRARRQLAELRQRLEKRFRLRWLTFADGKDPSRTDIAAALAAAAREDAAGVLLITDGNHNAGGSPVEAARAAQVPIYAVRVGSAEPPPPPRPSVKLLSVSAPLETTADEDVTIALRAQVEGPAGLVSRATLSEDGERVGAAALAADGPSGTSTAALTWSPGKPPGKDGAVYGVRRLRLAVTAEAEGAPAAGEEVELHIAVVPRPVRVLYVEGTLRPEYKFLRRRLAADPGMEAVSLVHIQGDRFLCQGSVGGEKLTAPPQTPEGLRGFDVVILGDLAAKSLTRKQMSAIQEFVKGGGGFLAIGGVSSFAAGGYAGTPIEELLPVALGEKGRGPQTGAFRAKLTAPGRHHPIFRDWGDDPRLPELHGCARVGAPRPGAVVLAVHPRPAPGEAPAVILAVGRYGPGRTAAFTGDTTWRWQLAARGKPGDDPHARFWRQTIRWLGGAAPRPEGLGPLAVLRLDPPCPRVGRRMQVRALVRDSQGRRADTATVRCVMTPAGEGKPTPVSLPLRHAPSGGYAIEHVPQRPGRYAVRLVALDASGQAIASDRTLVSVRPGDAQERRAARNDALLRRLAEVSGGKHADLDALDKLLEELLPADGDK